MRVAYVVDRWVELSQTFILSEVQELRRQGVHVEVVALHRATLRDDEPATYLRDTPGGVGVHLAAHAQWAARSPLRYARFLQLVRGLPPRDRDEIAWRRLPWVATRLAESGVDRLHAHFAWAGASAARSLAALTGWPWALTVHARDIYAPRPGVQTKLEDCDLLVTVCRFNVGLLRDRYRLARPVELVVCGVVPPEVFGRQPRTTDVVAVGRLVEKKGFDLLLRAFRRVADARPGSTLTLVGSGPLADELADLRRSLSLEAEVRLAGSMPHDEALAEVDRARVFCLPARVARDGDADSMPLVLKEAMARGVPVVGTSVGAIPEMLDDAVGLLLPPDDEAALADALLELLGDEARRARLGLAGRTRVEERYTLQGEVRRLRAALGRMVNTG